MKHFKSSRAAPFHRLTTGQTILFVILFAMAFAGGPALTFLVAWLAPEVDPGPYPFLFQLICLLGGLLLLRSAHDVRRPRIALFAALIGIAFIIGLVGLSG